jgi:error-prone DNA polymerase
LVVEVALIRPGPIQGGSVHPYLRRRNHEEEVTYLHPLLEACLERTLGVPLFQEQLMQIAVDVAGFTPGEADRLRQAMGSKRSAERMEALRERFYQGMAERQITGALADEIFSKMAAFSNFGFPESHSVSFAYLVYASAWLKLRYPAAFTASLLNSQPMGFWAPRTLVADTRRHGVEVRRAEVNQSQAGATLEPGEDRRYPAIRLGLGSLRALGSEATDRIVAGQPYSSLEDLGRRAELSVAQLESLATAGAAAGLDQGNRRRALWAAGAVAWPGEGRLPGMSVGAQSPQLPEMTAEEEVVADLWASGVSPDSSLNELVRPQLAARGVTPAEELLGKPDGTKVLVAGVVTHRQRPETAAGITFVNLEDETGLVNVVCSVGVWARYRRVAQSAPAMLISGRLESAHGVVNVVAERIEALELAVATRARDFG